MSVRLSRLLLLAAGMLSAGTALCAQATAPITVAPPPLPVYVQPNCPGDGDLWTPGYWAWDGSYYWVPGTWVPYPQPSLLWTPGYWSWDAGVYIFHEGYWAPTVGYYGGIDYGLGYPGMGFEGGRWDGGHFDYNTAVSRVDKSVTSHLYNTPVNDPVSRISYNGGAGGVKMSLPPPEEGVVSFAVAPHVPPVPEQIQHEWIARNDPAQRYSANHGTPPIAANAVPLVAIHAKELSPVRHPVSAKYQKQGDQLVTKQTEEREKLQKKQDAEDQDARQKNNPAKMQQVEQQHLAQTQEVMRRQAQQAKEIQERR